MTPARAFVTAFAATLLFGLAAVAVAEGWLTTTQGDRYG